MRTAKVDLEAKLVFVGYGVTAPEYGYDDLAGVDLKGKIAVVFSSAPLSDKDDFFPFIAHAIYSDGREKAARLSARGAVGMITVFRLEDEERLPWVRVGKGARIEQMAWLKNGEPGTSAPGIPLRGTLHWKAFDAILARAGISGTTATLTAGMNKRTQKPFDIPVSLHGKLASKLRDLDSHNVVGILRGSDPKLAGEYVVYSAHLDHLGIGSPIDGDAVYNGALDNASGTAAILEIARAFSMAPRRPARSILFLACTGEERGLLGSDYFARFPTVPAGSIVADFNDDMVLGLAPLHDVVALGAEHSTLGPLAVQRREVTRPRDEPRSGAEAADLHPLGSVLVRPAGDPVARRGAGPEGRAGTHGGLCGQAERVDFDALSRSQGRVGSHLQLRSHGTSRARRVARRSRGRQRDRASRLGQGRHPRDEVRDDQVDAHAGRARDLHTNVSSCDHESRATHSRRGPR